MIGRSACFETSFVGSVDLLCPASALDVPGSMAADVASAFFPRPFSGRLEEDRTCRRMDLRGVYWPVGTFVSICALSESSTPEEGSTERGRDMESPVFGAVVAFSLPLSFLRRSFALSAVTVDDRRRTLDSPEPELAAIGDLWTGKGADKSGRFEMLSDGSAGMW